MNRRETLPFQVDHRPKVMGRRIPAQVLEAEDHAVVEHNQVVVMPGMYMQAPQHVLVGADKIPLDRRRAVVPLRAKQLCQVTPMIGMRRELTPDDAMRQTATLHLVHRAICYPAPARPSIGAAIPQWWAAARIPAGAAWRRTWTTVAMVRSMKPAEATKTIRGSPRSSSHPKRSGVS